jgi:hypothetical protein
MGGSGRSLGDGEDEARVSALGPALRLIGACSAPRRARAVTVSQPADPGRDDEDPGWVGDSLWEYSRHVLSRWWWLVLGVVAAGLGLYTVFGSHILGVRSWLWFLLALVAFSVAQFFAFHDVRKERNDVLTAPVNAKVSVYAVAASRGSVPPPVVAPVEYQLHALRQVLAFLRAEGHQAVDVDLIDSVLKRLERDGVKLSYEPLVTYDCEDGLRQLVATGELIPVPQRPGFSYRLAAAVSS